MAWPLERNINKTIALTSWSCPGLYGYGKLISHINTMIRSIVTWWQLQLQSSWPQFFPGDRRLRRHRPELTSPKRDIRICAQEDIIRLFVKHDTCGVPLWCTDSRPAACICMNDMHAAHAFCMRYFQSSSATSRDSVPCNRYNK